MTYQDNIVRLRDTKNVPVQENGSPMVKIDPGLFRVSYLKQDMIPLLGQDMFARREVVERLQRIQERLNRSSEDVTLSIAYAYRAPIIQEQYFSLRLQEVQRQNPNLSEDEQIELTHSMVAHPSTAGHTTGAAVDLTLWNRQTNTPIDMGSGIAEFGNIAYTMYPNITSSQRANRMKLQKLMVEENFAPFLAEWWHFSYGDKEWAFFYKQPTALFDVVALDSIPT